MTAPLRQPRPARPPLRAPRRDPRVGLVPPADVRRRRGPTPPDAIVARLGRVLEAELRRGHQDAEGDRDSDVRGLGPAWTAALAVGLTRLVAHARRGVVGALAGLAAAALAREAPADLGPGDAQEITTALEVEIAAKRQRGAALASVIAGALGVLAEAILRLHTRLVSTVARAAGASRYVWTTQRDERVRELHRKLEGTVQSWDAPPLAGLPDFHGHPGEAAGPCRCQAWPLVG